MNKITIESVTLIHGKLEVIRIIHIDDVYPDKKYKNIYCSMDDEIVLLESIVIQ